MQPMKIKAIAKIEPHDIVAGVTVVRVTTLLKECLPTQEGLQRWRDRALLDAHDRTAGDLDTAYAERERETRGPAQIGTFVHELIAGPTSIEHASAPKPPSRLPADILPALSEGVPATVRHLRNAWREYYAAEGQYMEVKLREARISVRVGSVIVTGQPDAVLFDTRTGEWVLVDWKTTRTTYPEQAAQLSVYRTMLEAHGVVVGSTQIVRLDRRSPGSYEVWDMSTATEWLPHLLMAYRLEEHVNMTRIGGGDDDDYDI